MTPAYRSSGQPVSREDFYALACDPRRSVVVEACAGAGKTWMLVSRILRALLYGAQPHEILAITFTRKAAGEMRSRLNDWLREYAAPECGDATRLQALVDRGVPPAQAPGLIKPLAALHRQLLEAGRPVEIRTFHAWFAQLLRAAPLELLDELGLQPDMDLIESLDDHLDEVHRRFHAGLLRNDALKADHALLIAQRGRSQARKWLDTVLNRRVELELADEAGVLDQSVPPAHTLWPHLSGLDHPAVQLIAAAFVDHLRSAAAALAASTKAPQRKAAEGLAAALQAGDASQRFALAWSALFTTSDTPRKLGDLPVVSSLQDALQQIGEQIAQHEAQLEHLRMVRLSRLLLAEYAAYKRQRGLADMADLERCALALLRDSTLAGWVQERLDARIRHVLIDEFQDTSPLQWHALHAWLSAYAGAGGGASGHKPPAVFIVGDPKQSIYRFRRAEPRVFEAASHFVAQALDGCLLACDHTRRNAPAVLAALNTVFEQAQAAGEFGGFRAHTTEVHALEVHASEAASATADVQTAAGVDALPQVMRPPRTKGEGAESAAEGDAGADDEAAPVWRDSLTQPRHEPDEVLREREATRVADAIQSLVASGQVAPGEVLVLCRKRESLRLVAQALRERHLPYAASEDAALAEAPEALDLIALLDVLASPGHRLSLARVLRSPLFGVSDADLLALAQRADGAGDHSADQGADHRANLRADQRGDWWQALLSAPSGSSQDSPALARARRLLPGWHEAARRLPPHDLLDRIVAEGELRERLAAAVPPEQRLAALDMVDAFLAQALQLDGARYATPYALVRALKQRRIAIAPPSHPEAVQLLTVHGAKGLEAQVVFVMDADPERRNEDNATLLVDWPVESAHPQRCAFVYSESRVPASLHELMAAEQLARRREELNGLYVAMTRARRQLVFSATQPYSRSRGASASWWQRLSPVARPWTPHTPRKPRTSSSQDIPEAARFTLPVLPVLPARSAAMAVEADTIEPARADSPATRLGQAVHRVLEWATLGGAAGGPEASHAQLQDDLLAILAEGAAAEFAAPAAEVQRLAGSILTSPQCRRFFAGPGLRWAGNEVPIASQGESLRIDRLVQIDDAGTLTWWVLDYKLNPQPQELAGNRAQLLRYREAVRLAEPGAPVRCAFITGRGELLEID